jgi:hypothetical protein
MGPDLRFFHFCEVETGEDGLHFRNVSLKPDDTFMVVDPFIILKKRNTGG